MVRGEVAGEEGRGGEDDRGETEGERVGRG